MNNPLDPAATVTRAEVEDFLYHEPTCWINGSSTTCSAC